MLTELLFGNDKVMKHQMKIEIWVAGTTTAQTCITSTSMTETWLASTSTMETCIASTPTTEICIASTSDKHD